MKRLDLVGHRFGKLAVIKTIVGDVKDSTIVECLCDCGKTKIIRAKELKQGIHKSCGCSQFKEKTSSHPLYSTWKGIRERCNYPKAQMYKYYGGRGVKVCEEWQNSFIAFRGWAIKNGWRNGLQIDKDIIPKKLGIPALLYSPETCCFVDRKENIYNSTVAKLTKEQVLEIRNYDINWKVACEKYGIHNTTFYDIKNNKIWTDI